MSAIRKGLAIILVLNTLIGVFWQPLVYADFKLRQDYIATVLCIKKDEPITVCGGSCVLEERLGKLEFPTEQDNQPLPPNRLLEINFYLEKQHAEVPLSKVVDVMTPVFRQLQSAVHAGYESDVFNPPRV